MPLEKHYRTKVVLVGDKAVGKTSLIRRYVLDQFDDRYLLTLGSKVTKKVLDLDVPERDLRVQLDLAIWDIMGQTGLRNVMKEAYFYGASGALAVVDRTRPESLEGIDDWLEVVRHVAGAVPVVLAVNKNDLRAQAAIRIEEIEAAAARLRSEYLLTSAKTGDNVERAFQLLGNRVLRKLLGS